MSKKLFSKVFILLLVVGLLFAVAPKQAFAQTVPYAPDVSIQKAADEIVNSQMTEGGWGSAGMVVPQTVGVIGSGLIDAYARTNDPAHLASIDAAAAYLMTKTDNFSPADGMFAAKLDALLGGTTYTTFVKTNFFDKLAAGTYGATGDIDTAEYIHALYDYYVDPDTHKEIRVGDGYLNSEDPALGLISAYMCGAPTTPWADAVKVDLNLIDLDWETDHLMVAAKGIYSLAFVGASFDPTSGSFAAASDLAGMAAQLVSYQDLDGGFTYDPDWDLDVVVQTNYAILALDKVNPVLYQTQIQDAADYLLSVQNIAGYWGFWGNENYVSTAVSAQAVNEAFPAAPAEVLCTTDCYVDAVNGLDTNLGNAATPFATIQKAINTVVADGIVHVAAGTYTENLIVSTPLTVQSTNWEAKIVGTIGIRASNVTLQGLDISNPGSVAGINLSNDQVTPRLTLNHINILNNKIHDIGGYAGGNTKAIKAAHGPDNVTIEGNQFYNITNTSYGGSDAISFGDSAATDPSVGVVIRNNTFANITSLQKQANAISFNSNKGVTAIIENNTFEIDTISTVASLYSAYAIALERQVPGIQIRSNIFQATNPAAINPRTTVLLFNGSTPALATVIEKNHFLTTGSLVGSTSTVDVTENWWGQETGPAAGQVISGTAKFVPWCGNAECTILITPPVHNVEQGTYFNTIQAAINAAADGNTIEVAAGSYAESIDINKSINLIGAGRDLVTLTGTGTGENAVIDISVSNVTVQGFKIVAIDRKTVRITAATTNVQIKDNRLVGAANPTHANNFTLLETSGNQAGHLITGNIFEANLTSQVVYYNPTTNGITFTGNTFLGTTKPGGVGFVVDALSGTYDISTNNFTGLGGNPYAMMGLPGLTPTAMNTVYGNNTFPTGYAVVGTDIMLPPTKLNMSPATMTMDIAGGNQVVEIMATDVENMTAYHMEVNFDNTKLQVVSVENGTLLKSEIASVVEEGVKDLGNSTGRLIFGAYLKTVGGINYPVTGSGSLVKITFKPIDFGTTSFAIDGTKSAMYDWPNAFFIPYEVTGDADLTIVGFGPSVSFGYVAYDADPNGWLRGVSTDFTIVGANLTDATSLVVKLWGGEGGTTLLQTNTADLSGVLFDGFTGFTSPFDIFGNFNYAADLYWANVPEAEYGQTVAPTCVEAIATLADGTVITKKYCDDLFPSDRSLLLRGTIEPDGGTGQVPGGDLLTITNLDDTVSYLGLIEWYPAVEDLRTEGNRVGVEINAPTAFDTTGTTFTFAGTTYNWDAVNDGDNFVWIYPKVTAVPQQWDIVVAWGGNITQTFTVKVLETSTLNTPPLPTITSADVVGPYIPGVPREFTFNVSNAGGAYYALATFDYQIVGVSKADIASFEYKNELGNWIAMGSRPQETYVDCTVGGVASICGQFGWAPDGFGPFPADFTGNSQFRIKFLNGKTADLPLTLTLKGKKLGTETDWTVLQTFTANIDVYENVLITGTAPVYYLVGDAGASTITITNPAGGAPYGNHIEFKLTIFGAATTDIASATCDYGIPFDVLSKLSPDGSGNLTGTLIGADGAFEVGAGFDMTIPCTMVFNTAKDYTSTSEMVYVVGADKYVVATNTATAHVYTKPVITSTDLPGSFQQGVAETVTINVDNVDTMYTPNSFVLHLGFPEGTVVVYGDQNVTCDSNGCDILVTLVEGANPLALTVTFNVPSTDDVTVSLVDPAVEPDRTLATYTAANVVHANVALVTGTVTMQGRRTYTYADFTLTGTNIGYGPYHPLTTSNAAGQFSFANIIADTYTVTTNMPRYLNITSDLAKTIALSGNDALNTLWLRGGNATWINGDNIIDGLDASQVGTDWTTLFPVQNLEINCGDVNFDGLVNIQDLALVGGNFDLTSAQAYGTWLP